MKTRQSTPQPDVVRMRTFKLTEAPKLQLDELFSPTMALQGYKHLFADSSTPEQFNSESPSNSTNDHAASSSVESTARTREQQTPTRVRPHSDNRHDSPPSTPRIRLDSPSPAPTDETAPLRTSPILRLTSPPPPSKDVDVSLNSPGILSELGTPSSEIGNMQWSAAVGRATTGKSGRVIEKLMGDVDRLQRDKTLATVKLEEEVKRGESARSALESMQISNANLASIHEADKTFLTKKDRRIEELRADLEAERSRRDKAERETRDSRKERDEIVEALRREATENKQKAQRATSQYDVLARSWKSLEETYERQTSELRGHMTGLQNQIEGDKRKLDQLEVIVEQLANEGERSKRAKEKLSADFERYKKEQEAGLQGIRIKAEMNETVQAQTLEEMENTLGQMKYVINIKRNVYQDVDDAA